MFRMLIDSSPESAAPSHSDLIIQVDSSPEVKIGSRQFCFRSF